jgi:FtsH-binding integral membrane protein
MQNYNVTDYRTGSVQYDLGLRNFMLQVYNYMTVALAVSGMVAIGLNMSPELMKLIWTTNMKWVVIFLPLVFSLGYSFLFERMSVQGAKYGLIAFAAAMGLSLSSIFLVFKLGSIANVFFISAATFGAASIYGYTTKKDLTSFGSFLIMGVIGIFIASIVNIFLKSSAFAFAISIIGVLLFTGLTAYDTQNLKNVYDEADGYERDKAGVMGAFQLYLNFINIFIMLLNLLGEKK